MDSHPEGSCRTKESSLLSPASLGPRRPDNSLPARHALDTEYETESTVLHRQDHSGFSCFEGTEIREDAALYYELSNWGSDLSFSRTFGNGTSPTVEGSSLVSVTDDPRHGPAQYTPAINGEIVSLAEQPLNQDMQPVGDGLDKRRHVHPPIPTSKRRKLDGGRYTTVGTGDKLGWPPVDFSTQGEPLMNGAAHTITGHTPGNSTMAHLETPLMPESLILESPAAANVSDGDTSDPPKGSATSSDHEFASTSVSHISAQAHPHWPTFVSSATRYPIYYETGRALEDAIPTPPLGDRGVIIDNIIDTNDVGTHEVAFAPQTDTEGRHNTHSELITDLDDTEPGDIGFLSQGDMGDGNSSGKGAPGLVRLLTTIPDTTSPQDNNKVVDLDYTEIGDVVFAWKADAEDDRSAGSERDDGQIMDLDNLETGDVFFTSQADPEEDNNTDSETDNSQIADLNDTEAGDVASMAQTATGGGHSTGSGADDNQIMDLDDKETGDVVFVAQVGTEDEQDSTAGAADFVRRSTPAPYPTFPEDINQIMDLGDTETGDVVFASEANAHHINSETNNQIMHIGDTGTGSVVFVAQADIEGGHGTDPETGGGQIMDLDDTEAGDIFFTSQADTEDDNNTDSETDDIQIADLDDTETGDVTFMAQTDAGSGHNTDLEIGNDRIMDLDPDDRETGDVFFMSQADVENESDTGSEMDDSQFMDPDDTETEDVASASQTDASDGRTSKTELSDDSDAASITSIPDVTPRADGDSCHGVHSEPDETSVIDITTGLMPGAYLEDDCGNYTQPDNQIMDLDHVEAGGVIFRSRVDTEDMDSIHSETDGDQIMALDDVTTNSLADGSEAAPIIPSAARDETPFTDTRLRRFYGSRRSEKTRYGSENNPRRPSPVRSLQQYTPEHPREDPHRKTQWEPPVPLAGDHGQESHGSLQGVRTHKGELRLDTDNRSDPPVGGPSGRKPGGRVPTDSQTPTIELNGMLRDLAGLMHKVVAANENRYQSVVVALQQVTSRLRESQVGPTEKMISNGPQDRQSRASSVELKREIREHSLVLLGRKNKRSPVPAPPEPETIRIFNETGRGGPKGQPGKFTLDLEGPARSPWNKRAARCFRKHFRQCGLYADWPKKDIEEAFLRHTETIRSHYRRDRGTITLQQIIERNERASKKNRVNNLTDRRRIVCQTHKGMARFEKYVDALGRGGGMSEDEPDWRSASGKVPTNYFVVRPAWRSAEVISWLQVIDNVYLARRFMTDGRTTPGNWIRNRVRSGKVDQTAAPIKGLPVNFYDKEWLKSLPPRKRRGLRVSEAVDLSHTEEMIRIAARHAGVKKRSDKPFDSQPLMTQAGVV